MQTDMHKELKKEIHKYLNEIKCLMPCDIGNKNKYLRGLKEEIYDYAADNNIVSIGDIVSHFGEKEEVAKLYVDTLDKKIITKKLNFRRLITIVLITALAVWGVTAFIGYAVSRVDTANSYIVVNTENGEIL